MDFQQWRDATLELNSTFGMQVYTDPDRRVSTYMSSIGAGDTMDDFITRIRALTKGSGMGVVGIDMGTLPAIVDGWSTEFAAETINAYIREGFQ